MNRLLNIMLIVVGVAEILEKDYLFGLVLILISVFGVQKISESFK